jgi:MFS family permease
MSTNGKKTSSPSFMVGENYKWAIVAMLWVVSFFNYADRSAITAVMPKLKVEYGFTAAELGLLGTAFLWVYACSAPLAGFLGDRFKRKTIILGGLIFWSIITFVTPLAGSLGMFIFFRAMTGLGEASYYPAGTAMISDYHDRRTRTRALSLHQTAVFAGGIIGTTFAGYLADQYHWKYAFFLYGALGIVIAFVLWKMMKEPEKGMADQAEKVEKVPLSTVYKTPSAILLSIVFFGANFVTWALNTWMPTYLHDKYHMSLTMAAFAGTSALQLSSLSGVLIGGVIADLLVKRTILARFYILAAGLILAAPFVFISGQTMSVNVLIFSMIGAGFFKGIFDSSIYAAMHDVMTPAARSTAVGTMTAIGFAGGGLAPFIIGVYAPQLGLGMAMALTSILYVAVGGLLLIFRNVIKKDILKQSVKLPQGNLKAQVFNGAEAQRNSMGHS